MFMLIANMFILCQIFGQSERKSTVCQVSLDWTYPSCPFAQTPADPIELADAGDTLGVAVLRGRHTDELKSEYHGQSPT